MWTMPPRVVSWKSSALLFVAPFLWIAATMAIAEAEELNDFAWPAQDRDCRPYAYWWWMGGAQDKENLTRVLEMYRAAGMGGLQIVPIYGVKGWEDKFHDFLSPEWMTLLAHAISEGHRLGLGVDLSTGTGWPFGGPNVAPDDGATKIAPERRAIAPGETPAIEDANTLIAAVAGSSGGESIDLTEDIRKGALTWKCPGDGWTLYLLRGLPTGQVVKRAAPGGAGPVLDPYDVAALSRYLRRFEDAFAANSTERPRALYHDSFEYYNAQWTDTFFDVFQARRGYDLKSRLPEWLADPPNEVCARITCDYRQTIAELHLDYIRTWVDWTHQLGSQTRNQAHGAPGNILDLYAASDLPETEIFGATGFPIPGLRLDPDFKGDRPSPLMIKFASSAAHAAGKRLTGSESCTWLAEHFKVSLAQAKPEIDQLFAGGVNHIIYHGIPYSPPDEPWPGWLFYASTCFAPAGGLWRDLPELNAYIARCQSVLQYGAPANDVLLYFPIWDIWQSGATGAALRPLQVHNISDWLHCGGLGEVAAHLWEHGFGFDYVSDALLAAAVADSGGIRAGDGSYRAILIPPCTFMPLETLEHLVELAESGATILALEQLPGQVPGMHDAAMRQKQFAQMINALTFRETAVAGIREADPGSGRILAGNDLDTLLDAAGIRRETVSDHGVRFMRRTHEQGYHYFFANLGAEYVDGWFQLGVSAQSGVFLDPRRDDRTGVAAMRILPSGATECYLQLAPGESIILRTFTCKRVTGSPWPYREVDDSHPLEINGPWKVTFIEGGPELPPPFETARLASWTEQGGAAERFAGAARYETEIIIPPGEAADWVLDLGLVCESARVYVNGTLAGTLFSHPFRMAVGALLRGGKNDLVIEVTNLAANRIRDLDRRGVPWKKFLDANIVNIQYKPFDASGWPLMDSGLLGPVRLLPARVPPAAHETRAGDVAEIAPGWRGAVISEIDQSYVGWDVEIGDADNDGANEVLVTGCPDSRLYLLKYVGNSWETRLLARDLANRAPLPGMGLVVKVIDLNADGHNEVVVGTGQEGDTAGPAFCHVLHTDGLRILDRIAAQAVMKDSLYTHNAAFQDLDGDGLLEILSAYCGTGEVTRFDVDKPLTEISRRQLYLADGSGEDSFIADIDNDGRVEYLMCDCYREDQARVLIFEFDDAGELVQPPRVVIDGYDGVKCFNCSLETGDVDGDTKIELIVEWKPQWGVNCGTLIGYRVDASGAQPLYTFAREDPDLDLGYGEKMMCVSDADNDGKPDLTVSTRGEPPWNGNGLGHVFNFRVENAATPIQRTLLANFHAGKGDACWLAVGDADNDGENEVVVATGVGNRECAGVSHVLTLKKE